MGYSNRYDRKYTGTDFFWLYASEDVWRKYEHHKNPEEGNYFLLRKKVKFKDQDMFTYTKTSSHSFVLTHYRVRDGKTELIRFDRLYKLVHYVNQSIVDYDNLYSKPATEG